MIESNTNELESASLWRKYQGPEWSRKLIDRYWKAVCEFPIDKTTKIKGVTYPWISGHEVLLFVIETKKSSKTIWLLNGASASHNIVTKGEGFDSFVKEYDLATDFDKPVQDLLTSYLPGAEVTLYWISNKTSQDTIQFYRTGRPFFMLYMASGSVIKFDDLKAIEILKPGEPVSRSIYNLNNYLKRFRGQFDIRLTKDHQENDEIKVTNREKRKFIYLMIDKIIGLDRGDAKEADFQPIITVYEAYFMKKQ